MSSSELVGVYARMQSSPSILRSRLPPSCRSQAGNILAVVIHPLKHAVQIGVTWKQGVQTAKLRLGDNTAKTRKAPPGNCIPVQQLAGTL